MDEKVSVETVSVRIERKKKNQNKKSGMEPLLALREGLSFLINELSRSKCSDSGEHEGRILKCCKEIGRPVVWWCDRMFVGDVF